MDDTSEIDSIVSQTELSTNQEIPMEGPAPQEQAQPTSQEYEFESGGQKIKAPIEKILRWASMGHSAPNKIGELSKKLSDYEGKFKQYEQYDTTYRPIDDWAKKNPDKWQALFNNWQQAQFGVLPQGPTPTPTEAQAQNFQLPPEVIQKINAFDQKFSQLEQKEVVQRERAADQGLDGEIASIRKQYSNLDFDAPDTTGNTLEYQILKHATDNGIPSFRAAFRDYCFDKLGQFSETKGMEKASKTISPQTKAALLGKQPAGTKGQLPANFIKNRNYDQIHEAALAELGISG